MSKITDGSMDLYNKHYHFIGIGGCGMSALAEVLLRRGARVSGSDPQRNAATARLQAAGAVIARTQVAANIVSERPDVVVISAAIHDSNPELVAAKVAHLPVLIRAQLLGELMAAHTGPRIAIAGTHGKTTTTSMVALCLEKAGLDPTALIGGEFAPFHGNARIGDCGLFVTEACEAYGSFLSLHPDISVITNVEPDHLDYYGTPEHVAEAFRKFVGQTREGGCVISCADDTGAKGLLADTSALPTGVRSVTYGLTSADAMYTARDVETGESGTCFIAVRRAPDGTEEPLGKVQIPEPGDHNVRNALAAIAVCLEAGAAFAPVVDALAHFPGAGRRFERLGEPAGVLVIDDYAHHPTEISATLSAARAAYPHRRLVAVFQPHLYSRTRDFMKEFAHALCAADVVMLTGIYAAREDPDPSVQVSDIAKLIAQEAPDRTLLYIPDKADVPDALVRVCHAGDVVTIMGAGDIRKAGEEYIRRRSAA